MKLQGIVGFIIGFVMAAFCFLLFPKLFPTDHSGRPSYERLKEDKKKLKNQLNEATTNLKKAGYQKPEGKESKNNTDSNKFQSNEDDISSLFPESKDSTGSPILYKMKDKSFKFYSNPSCKDEYLIEKDLTFISWVDHEKFDPDEKNIISYVSRTKNGELVYSKGKPYFDPIDPLIQ